MQAEHLINGSSQNAKSAGFFSSFGGMVKKYLVKSYSLCLDK